MFRLIKIAFSKGSHRLLLLIALISMIGLTFASQLEVFALGVITQQGPSFFELFAPEKEGELGKPSLIKKSQLEKRWKELDPTGKGFVDQKMIEDFLESEGRTGFVQRGLNVINRAFPIKNNLTNLIFFLIIVAFFNAITLFAQRFSLRLIGIRVSEELRLEYFKHLQSLPMKFFQNHPIGALSARVVGDASLIAEAVNASLINYIQTPLIVLTTLILCFLASWQLSLVIFVGFPLLIFPIVFLAKGVKRLSKQLHQNQEKFASVLIDFLSGIMTVKVFNLEALSLEKYASYNSKMAQLEQRSARYDLATRPVVHTVAMTLLTATLLYGLYVLKMEVADLLVYSALLYFFYEPIKKFAEENSRIQRGLAAAERLSEIIQIEPTDQKEEKGLSFADFKDKISFQDVWFRYGEEWVLKGVSFTIQKGEKIAIVGPTGAGKSTIALLLPRLYDPQEGSILLDGHPLTSYSKKSLRNGIAFVPQKPFLFLDTIGQNISAGYEFNFKRIEKAAKMAHADDFIQALPKGYETELAETGKNLSGGQQQRLAIARALYRSASLLVMDEATSSLDALSEYHIKQALNQLKGKITQIIIAHRLSTIEDADRIIFLDQGRILNQGTKEELLKNCPAFKTMWQILHQEQ